jgi:CRP-like cAMP-binding protein
MWAAMDLTPYLQQNPLLQGFTEDGIKIIASVCVPRQIEMGQPIFVGGLHGESAFLLVAGEVQLTVDRPNGPRDLAVLTAPDVFGELSLLKPGPRRVTARARTQKQRPQACMKLLMNVSERLGQRLAETGPLLDKLVDQL